MCDTMEENGKNRRNVRISDRISKAFNTGPILCSIYESSEFNSSCGYLEVSTPLPRCKAKEPEEPKSLSETFVSLNANISKQKIDSRKEAICHKEGGSQECNRSRLILKRNSPLIELAFVLDTLPYLIALIWFVAVYLSMNSAV